MEIVVYKCPKCGAIVEEEILLTFPPNIRYRCPSCGWCKTEKTKIIHRVVEA